MNKICNDDLTFVNETPPKLVVKCPKHKITIEKALAVGTYKLQRNQSTYFCKTKQVQVNYHSNNKPPYVYYDIGKIIILNSENFPRNNKFHTIGTYSQENLKNFLVDIDKSPFTQTYFKLPLDFCSHDSVPKIGSIIELFGYVEFHSNSFNYSVPVFIVHFWKPLTGNIEWYIKNLNKKHAFIPKCYTFTENISVNMSCSKLEDHFNDSDDTILSKYADSVEKLVNEIKELMDINLDLFI